MYQYPYGDSQQLNLDWIINKLIELEQSFVAGESAELEEFANALISLTYIPTQAYNNSDIVFHDGHLYRCNTTIPAPGEVWDPSHWDQIMLGNTVANLVRAVAGMNSDHVFNESNVPGTHVTEALNALVEDVRYDNHKIQQKKNGAYTDVIPVEDTPSNNSDRLASSKAAYDLKGAINAITPLDTVPTNGSTKGITSDAVYDVTAPVSHTVEVKTGLDVQGGVYCYTIGKICFLVLRNVFFANAGNQQLLISGIPTPAFDQNSIATTGESAAITSAIADNTGTVSTDGNVYFNILPNTTQYRHWINFIYLTT